MATVFKHLFTRTPKAAIRRRKPDPQPRMRWYS
jgi:hypothetical protein